MLLTLLLLLQQISCEESLNNDGQCWQLDASGNAEATKLGGSEGGKFESVAVDPRDDDHPVFYVTEDRSGGALRRFIATLYYSVQSYQLNLLHLSRSAI